jgi:DNA-binding transcriptional ArsR family regulator
MVELLAQREEICAQDFMSLLELSQSSASRHLRQLTASGFLTERRRDVAKCYSLNRERLTDTLKALGQLTGAKL